MLTHLPTYAKLFGPLWTHCAFPFEDAIGHTHSCQLSRNVRDSPGFLPAVPAKKLLSRIFYPHWKCTNLCPELVVTLQHSQDTFSNTRAFNINGFVSNYVHFDLLSTWETPQKWA